MTDETDGVIRPVEPAYRTVLRLQWLTVVLPILAISVLIDWLVLRGNALPWGFLTVAGVLLAILLSAMLPARQYDRLGYHMGADNLRIVRGYLFHTDTVVPFVRVQHIDVGQGPIERMNAVAHVVVHTAGTHNSTVTLPGLAHADAIAMRDTIRSHIRTDFA